jgi:hypothetical protein
MLIYTTTVYAQHTLSHSFGRYVMKTKSWFITLLVSLVCFSITMIAQKAKPLTIYNGKTLAAGYDMGLNTDSGRTDWLKKTGKEFILSYPEGQSWGAVFITVGKPQSDEGKRLTSNYSIYDTLVISMRGAHGGENIEIGIKDVSDPDNGSETKVQTTLSKHYKQYSFSLAGFSTANLQKLYVVTEFVFSSQAAETIYVNSIKVK